MIYLLIMVFGLSLVLTWVFRRYALAKNILDIPNHRSSHTAPTPRGGGMAFILTLLLTAPIIYYFYPLSSEISIAIMGGGLFIALLGFLDDKRHVPPYLRFLGHFLAASFTLFWLGGMPTISFGYWVLPMGLGLNILGVIYVVWLLNLYNFMDGIDGIAAIEAISVCLGGAFLYALQSRYALTEGPLLLAAAVGGFLWWNFPPARIFMGDAGSGFLGLIFGIFTIQAAGVEGGLFWSWLILLGVFVVDATVTLIYRMAQGSKLYEAHCDHAYQHAAQRMNSHLRVTLGVLFINVFWLFPMAIMVEKRILAGIAGLVIAYFPLVILAIMLKAGRCNQHSTVGRIKLHV